MRIHSDFDGRAVDGVTQRLPGLPPCVPQYHSIRLPEGVPDGVPMRVVLLWEPPVLNETDLKQLFVGVTEGLTDKDLERQLDQCTNNKGPRIAILKVVSNPPTAAGRSCASPPGAGLSWRGPVGSGPHLGDADSCASQCPGGFDGGAWLVGQILDRGCWNSELVEEAIRGLKGPWSQGGTVDESLRAALAWVRRGEDWLDERMIPPGDGGCIARAAVLAGGTGGGDGGGCVVSVDGWQPGSREFAWVLPHPWQP